MWNKCDISVLNRTGLPSLEGPAQALPLPTVRMTTAADIKAEAEADAGIGKDQKDSPSSKPSEPKEQPKDEPNAPPSLPKRPSSPFTKAMNELREAFPGDNAAISRAVLVAAGGNLEQAFNGMLALTDETIRPVQPPSTRSKRNTQIEEDEQLARHLAKKYDRRRSRGAGYSARYSDGPPPTTDDNDDSFFGGVSQLWGSLREKIRNEVQDDDVPAPHSREASKRSSIGSGGGVIQMEDDNTNADEAPALPRRRASSRPVNAFGDEIPHADVSLQHEEPESETFFIGDESDDDLGSLDGNQPAVPASPSNKDSQEESKDSAKYLLSKVKGEAEKKKSKE